jgi:hypothetical protein
MSAQQLSAGGWTAYHPLTPEDLQVFQKALTGFVGVNYIPEEVATQIVQGVNYRYLTKASQPGQTNSWKAVVEIYVPLSGDPHVIQIFRI